MRKTSLLLLAARGLFASPTSYPYLSPDHILDSRQASGQNASLLGYPIYSSGPFIFVTCDVRQGGAPLDLFPNIDRIINDQIMPPSLAPTSDPAQDPFPFFFVAPFERGAFGNSCEIFVARGIFRPSHLSHGFHPAAAAAGCTCIIRRSTGHYRSLSVFHWGRYSGAEDQFDGVGVFALNQRGLAREGEEVGGRCLKWAATGSGVVM